MPILSSLPWFFTRPRARFATVECGDAGSAFRGALGSAALRLLRAAASAWLLALSLTSAGEVPRANLIQLPGPRPDGSMLLPNQWSLRPAGKQVQLGDFPVNIAVHPSSRFAAVLHCGYGQHEVVVVSLPAARVVSRVSLNEAFYGLAFSPDGTRLYASGASDETVHAFEFSEGLLQRPQELRLRPVTERGVVGGLAVSQDGKKLWATSVWGHRVSELGLADGGVAFDLLLAGKSTAGASLPTPPSSPDLAAATKRDRSESVV